MRISKPTPKSDGRFSGSSKFEARGSKNRLSRSTLLRFSEGAKIKNYVILDNPLSTAAKSRYSRPLGVGGSGTVFLASQILHGSVEIKRAIKFFVYRDDIAQKTINRKDGVISRKDFLNEILNIAGFSHENLVKVTDAGMYDGPGETVPFIVYDYIKGPDLKQVIGSPLEQRGGHQGAAVRKRFCAEPDRVLKLLIQIAAGLKCLHDRGFAHCDMAPKNILLKADEDFKPVIGDLGVGRSLARACPRRAMLGSQDLVEYGSFPQFR